MSAGDRCNKEKVKQHEETESVTDSVWKGFPEGTSE